MQRGGGHRSGAGSVFNQRGGGVKAVASKRRGDRAGQEFSTQYHNGYQLLTFLQASTAVR